MLSLSAKIRKTQGRKTKALRLKGVLPAVLYGLKIKTESLEINVKEFQKVYQETGESTLISLEVEGEKKKYLVLIHDLKRDPLTSEIIHVDFYQPSLDKEIEVRVPVILDGEAPAVKNLGGTLIKNIGEMEVKALPQKLPKEIRVDISGLTTFENHILVKDLKLGEGIKILKEPDEIVASVAPPEKVEEELAKPVEEKVEEVEKIEKEKKEKVEEEKEEAAPAGEPRPVSSGREKKEK